VGQLRKAIAKETQERIGELTSLVQEDAVGVRAPDGAALRHRRLRVGPLPREETTRVRRLSIRQNVVGRWVLLLAAPVRLGRAGDDLRLRRLARDPRRG
jgi:hypothetical protein